MSDKMPWPLIEKQYCFEMKTLFTSSVPVERHITKLGEYYEVPQDQAEALWRGCNALLKLHERWGLTLETPESTALDDMTDAIALLRKGVRSE